MDNTNHEESDLIQTTPDFEKKFGYQMNINKILVANNGIAAVKCIRSIRQWCYNTYLNEKVICFVAMVTPEDFESNSEYIQLADEYVSVPGGPSFMNYGNVDLIVETALQVNAQAVWAGWGHASENPALSEKLLKKNVIFLGPNATSMWLVGDKIASNIIAQTLGVPTLPWSGSGIVTKKTKSGLITQVNPELYSKSVIVTASGLTKTANKIGFPVIVKASAGGGGKGIRKLYDSADCEKMLRQVQGEVPNSPVFVMKLIENVRHIEVQLIGDLYGNVKSVFGRDCTIQRRHQKIMEEAPPTACPDSVFSSMEEDARKIGMAVSYSGLGTVEYLYNEDTKNYYFLELNPRLQVEHPCTEIIAEVNLPACQLLVGIGKHLSEIPEIERLMSLKNNDVLPKGHVIAARITAENPEEGFRPSSGSLRKLNFRSSKNTWGYFSIQSEGILHKHSDSQFGHIFSWGYNREEARKNMIVALKELSIQGEIRTTTEFLVGVLEHHDFKSNRFNTSWLDTLISQKDIIKKPSDKVFITCAAACITSNVIRQRYAFFEDALHKGHILSASKICDPINVEFIYRIFKYRLTVHQKSQHSLLLVLNETCQEVNVRQINNDELLVSFDKRSYTCFLRENSTSYLLDVGGSSCIMYKESDPSLLFSPSGGKIISYLVNDGSHVFKGTDYAEIEIMKMIMTLSADESGNIHFLKPLGAHIEPNTVIARLDIEDPSKLQSARPFTDGFYGFDKISENGRKPSITSCDSYASGSEYSNGSIRYSHRTIEAVKNNFCNIMDGYCIEDPFF